MSQGTLYLAPTGLGAHAGILLPHATLEVVHSVARFIAENPKSARAFLKEIGHPRPLREIQIDTLNEHTPAADIPTLLQPLEAGEDCALLSEAGCPAVADPGAALVRAAHAARVRVVPLVGPSALLLAVMASGMNGQRFAFHGYVPVERSERARRLATLERDSEQQQVAQMFIEAPYRNEALLEAILQTCRPDTQLCIATDLTLATESIRSQTISEWKAERPAIDRRPSVFLLYRSGAARRQKR